MISSYTLKDYLDKYSNFIDSGTYASVYKDPSDPNAVIKICSDPDDPVIDYLEWCYTEGKDYLWTPKVYRIIRYIDSYIVWMKKYNRYPSKGDKWSRDEAFKEMKPYFEYLHKCGLRFETDDYWGNGIHIGNREVMFDLHPGNIMWDNDLNHSIITDPFHNTYIKRLPPQPIFKAHNVRRVTQY